MRASKFIAVVGGILHLVFAFGEIVPLPDEMPSKDGMPFIVKSIVEKKEVAFEADKQRPLVLNIVRNAGTYNFVVAMGFFWAAFPVGCGESQKQMFARLLQTFFFTAAILLGLVGLSLSILTASQSILGVIGLLALYAQKPSSPSPVQ